MNYDILLTFSLATAALALSPGPDNIFVLIQSITHRKRYGFATIAGLMTGCLVHTTLLAFGVSAVIKENDSFFFVMKLFGAIYLVFLAFQVFRSDSTISLSNEGMPKKSIGKLFRQGFIMNVLNPKVTIFFLAFFPGFLFSDTMSTVIQFYVLGLLFIAVSSIVFGAITIFSGVISDRIMKNANVGVLLKWLQIIVFVCIAVFLFLSDK
ncbi:MAG: threonine/homoserine/homoserine lactone efflux protein [Maribacter sp.]